MSKSVLICLAHYLKQMIYSGMAELVIQLAAIMCGKQIFNAIVEITYP